MTFHTVVLVLSLFITAMTASAPDGNVTGSATDTVTLPCNYSPGEKRDICWRSTSCPKSECSNPILQTDGSTVTKRKSHRYKLLGNQTEGNASLTISGATGEDDGNYCCALFIPGATNVSKREIYLKTVEIGPAAPDTLTLPCIMSLSNESYSLFWGRGDCSCRNALLRTNGSVTSRTSDRYWFLGNITEGNMSMTMSRLTKEDEGPYCCKMLTPKNVKKVVVLRILESDDRNKWNIHLIGNIIRGILIILLPLLVLTIYYCCPLEIYYPEEAGEHYE
ncbi:uncharacterized protein [Engystomops pustulosus]|uniref:uncharacterized protein n=1 Tax=Engystomops pustulosus TaxID=76066 RepID=UPI003AFAF5D9